VSGPERAPGWEAEASDDDGDDDGDGAEPGNPIREVLAALEVRPDPAGGDVFVGDPSGEGGARVFGGQVVAQALRAAAATVEVAHLVNSLHAYFVRPGRYNEPIRYAVDRVRDGRSFTTRRVAALQGGEVILDLHASFHAAEPGRSFQPPSPVGEVVPPDAGETMPRPPWARRRPLDMRWAASPDPATRGVWVRAPTRLPDDPTVHACLVAFLSDMGPVGVVRAAVDEDDRRPGPWRGFPSPDGRQTMMMASLDHCMWFHRPVRADEWLLYELSPVAAAGARGVARGAIWTASGDLGVTLVQEVLARPLDPPLTR
jgi:acyl-CoA thioesterase II